MLFNSPEFIFIFLPVAFVGYQLLQWSNLPNLPVIWLAIASLVFYGYWNVGYIVLIFISISANFIIAGSLGNIPHSKIATGKFILTLGIAFNLGLLGYFKYTNFFIENINAFFPRNIELELIILPIGISFFTFQQIAYLVDVYRKEVYEHTFAKYCLFVSFFPQLIAGPIVHHREMMPQFGKQDRTSPDYSRGGLKEVVSVV